MADQRLADDADALADLRRGVARERLVQDELVDPLDLLAAVLLRPRHPEPALVRELLHERAALGRVGELGEVLARRVHHDRVVIVLKPLLDFVGKRLFLRREIEVHGGPPRRRWPSAGAATSRQPIYDTRRIAIGERGTSARWLPRSSTRCGDRSRTAEGAADRTRPRARARARRAVRPRALQALRDVAPPARCASVLDRMIPIERRHVAFWQDFLGLRLTALGARRRIELALLVGVCRAVRRARDPPRARGDRGVRRAQVPRDLGDLPRQPARARACAGSCATSSSTRTRS